MVGTAPRIHGELLKLGYDISETTIAKYMAGILDHQYKHGGLSS